MTIGGKGWGCECQAREASIKHTAALLPTLLGVAAAAAPELALPALQLLHEVVAPPWGAGRP